MKKQNNVTRYSLLCLMALFALPSTASTFSFTDQQSQGEKNSTLKNLVVKSDLVFRGKLTEISEALSIEEIPYTFVTYNVQEVISGKYSKDTITLKFAGGEFPNGNRLSASNSPDVQLGEEAILMVQQTRDTGCDFVECEYGRFILKNGKVIAANDSAIILDDQNGVDYISHAAQKSGVHKASLAKSNITRFISHLKSISKKSALQKSIAQNEFLDIDKNVPFNAYSGLTQAKNGPKVPSSIQKKSSKATVKGNAHDQWEVEQLKNNGGDPLLNTSYQK